MGTQFHGRIEQNQNSRLTMISKVIISALLVCSSQAGNWKASSRQASNRPAGNLVEELAANGASTLIDFAVKAGLADTLTGDGPFTIFAPTNAAFAALPQEIVDAVSADTELLKSVLLYHVVPGNILSSQASNDLKLDTAEGTSLQVNVYKKPHHYGNTITVNGKRVIKADIKASNGVIHLIDGVMLIPKGDLVDTLVGDDRFSTLVAAVTAAGLVDTVKNADAFTIFAPTNDAFAKIPEETLNGLLADKEALTKVLLRHVAPGAVFAKGISWGSISTAGGEDVSTKVFKTGMVKVSSSSSSAMVVEADITATNGVVHAIDTVI